MHFHTPKSLEDALSLIADPSTRVLAGGTDFYPALGGAPAQMPIVHLGRIPDLSGITRDGAQWRFGATTTWTDIARADLPPLFTALRQAAREVGSIQIQNAGTIAGNLCNASPAADGVPPLLALDASVELASASGRRVLPLADFITGVRKTALRPGELVTAVLVPDQPTWRSAFGKLGARRYLVISIAMVAVAVELDETGAIQSARIAIGSCSPVARRLPQVEAALVGLNPKEERLGACLAEADLSPLSPLDDVRASASYRLDAARELIRRAIIAATTAAAEGKG